LILSAHLIDDGIRDHFVAGGARWSLAGSLGL
jgi:hypothetical protein